MNEIFMLLIFSALSVSVLAQNRLITGKVLNAGGMTSISVLKDASSAAIYSARTANGVVLITTRRGKENIPGWRKLQTTN